MLMNIYFEDFVDGMCHRQEFEFPYKEGDQTTQQSRDKAWYALFPAFSFRSLSSSPMARY